MRELVHDQAGEEEGEAELLGDLRVFELGELLGDDVVVCVETDDGAGELLGLGVVPDAEVVADGARCGPDAAAGFLVELFFEGEMDDVGFTELVEMADYFGRIDGSKRDVRGDALAGFAILGCHLSIVAAGAKCDGHPELHTDGLREKLCGKTKSRD